MMRSSIVAVAAAAVVALVALVALVDRGVHIARLAVALVVLLAAIVVAGCHFYDDDGRPIPSSSWSWRCADGSIIGDAGCPTSDADGGTSRDGAAARAGQSAP